MPHCRGCYECGIYPLASINYGEFLGYTEAMDNWVLGFPLSACYCIIHKLHRTSVRQLKVPKYLAKGVTKSIFVDRIARQLKEHVKLYTRKGVK